ncbi:MAG: UDP-N-acetylmuramoyl-tripeptide--D-alanyl-D-alanine ligase [Bacteroidota bacterium]|nr:UDP-N-acetylmuramoyl-tripeptide--D-alanyl-D-alanine ligase [Bacteroidota bacterium]
MKKITASDLKKMTGVELVNQELLKRRVISGVSTDSRAVKKNDLFFALKGEKFDAHEFIDSVVKAEAVAIVVHREWARKNDKYFRTFPCVFAIVNDTTVAFGELARIYRRKFDIPVIAIGGSNGKTTTKEMVNAVLRTTYNVLSTEGNLNNHIGVPQTLFRLTSKHDVAVVEIGTNHFGEVKYLCEIAEPTHGLITNIGKEHLEFFGDEDGVAKEELELFNYLNSHHGIAFVNCDDRYVETGSKKLKKQVSYGMMSKADIRAKKIHTNELGQSKFEIVWQKKNILYSVSLEVPGLHNVMNALAASAVGLTLRVKAKKITEALEHFSSTSKRMEVLPKNGITILNDTYNSNPDSVIVALKTLTLFNTNAKKIVVLGDMRELGEASKREHTNIGVIVAEMKFNHLFTVGPFSKYTSEAFGSTAKHFESKDELSNELRKILKPGDVVLVKGSRGMKMEDIVYQLTQSNGQLNVKDAH